MRTPLGSVATADRFHPHDAVPNANVSPTKMPSQQQIICHPNQQPPAGRYGSSSGVGPQPMDIGDGSDRHEGRRSRRGSYDASPGAKRQRFEIIRKLGSGTYGKVSLALDHRTGEEVAVKVIKKSAIENTADLIRIRREIRIMSALRHPNIIEIKEVFENGEKIILVMEYASSGELYDYVSSQGPLGEVEVRRLFRQITSAVYYCHKHGVAHRDLKLENILLDRSMNAKIADFGLSNYFKPSSLLYTFCGSPLYASPEIINGTPYKGPEVDCWSLGVLLYTLAYSSMPFDGRDFNRMIRQIKRGAYYEPDPPSSASTLIRSMLRVNPDRRADIDNIAGHWWLNYDENMPNISDLQENQVLDSTPLYIRQETLMIQSLGEEHEVFAEYTHLSEATRKKVEEFRRRKKEADWYLTDSQSPVRKQSKKRSSSAVNDRRRSSQTMNQKLGSQAALAGVTKKQSSHALIKQQTPTAAAAPTAPAFISGAKPAAGAAPGHPATPVPSTATVAGKSPFPQPPTPVPSAAPIEEPKPPPPKPMPRIPDSVHGTMHVLQVDPEEAPPLSEEPVSACKTIPRPSTMVLLNSPIKPKKAPTVLHLPEPEPEPEPISEPAPESTQIEAATNASVDTAIVEEANRLINRLMEEALRGPVALETIETIRTSEAYSKEQFVKDILESVIVAQQPKAAKTPSMHSVRGSRSKHSSMTRMPPSASASMSSNHGADGYLDGMDTLPPGDVSISYYDDGFISPSAQLTMPLPHHNILHQTVPEEAEMEFDQTATEYKVARRVSGVPSIHEADEEEEEEEEDDEEDVCSTDFEDLQESSSESEAEMVSANSLQEETDIELVSDTVVPISTVDSFASLHSDEEQLSDIRPVVAAPAVPETAPIPAEPAAVPEPDSSPPAAAPRVFRRGLAKRISRGKYERSKFTFGREISIQNSPRASRRRIGGVQPQPKDAPKLFQKAKQYILLYPNPERGSPERGSEGRRRRYSDGDKKEDKLSTQGSETPCGKDRPKPIEKGAAVQNGSAVGSKPRPPAIHCEYANGNPHNYCNGELTEDEMMALSAQRRQERERERRSIMGDYNAVNGYCGELPVDNGSYPYQIPITLFQPFPPQNSKKRTYVTAGEAKSVGASEPCTLQVAQVTKTRRASAEPLLDILEAGGGQADEYDSGTASYGMPRTPTLARPPSFNALDAELRRQSYHNSAADDSLNSTEDGDRTSNENSNPAVAAVIVAAATAAAATGPPVMTVNVVPQEIPPSPPPAPLPLVSPPPYDPPLTPNRVRYASPASNGPGSTSTNESYWLQQFTKDDHRHQTPTSHNSHNSDAGDRSRLMSPMSPNYDRPDDEHYHTRAYVHGASYRSSSVFTAPHSREMSPAQGRSLVSPLRTTYYDPDPISRQQRAKSWYASRDLAGSSFEGGVSTSNRYGSGSSRFEPAPSKTNNANGNAAVANYFRSFFDVAYNRVPRMQDLKYEREKTPLGAGPFGDLLDRQASMKRRSRSLDKSLHASEVSTTRRPPTLSFRTNVAYTPDDRVDVSSLAPPSRVHDASMGLRMQNVGGAGRFGTLLLNTGATQSSEKVPTKGILKKQSAVATYGRHPETEAKKVSNSELGSSRPTNFMDRIRRHLSTEKSPAASRASEPPPDFKARTSNRRSSSPDSSKGASKKRNVLQLARRRTQEAGRIANGNESGYGSGSVSSDEYSTPIEKIKGFFSGGQSAKAVRESTPTVAMGSSNAGFHHHPSREIGAASGALYVAAYRKAYQSTHKPHGYMPPGRYEHII